MLSRLTAWFQQRKRTPELDERSREQVAERHTHEELSRRSGVVDNPQVRSAADAAFRKPR